MLEKSGWDILYILIGLQVKNLGFLFYELYFFLKKLLFVTGKNSHKDGHKSHDCDCLELSQ